MGLAELKADCAVHRERILRMDFAKLGDAGKVIQTELAENVWPWLDGLIDSLREEVLEEVADLGEAIDEIIEREDSALHPELAAMILGVFEAGKLICLETEKLLATSDDEVGKKRVGEMLMAYRQGVAIVSERVAEVTLDEEEEKPKDEQAAEGEAEEVAAEVDAAVDAAAIAEAADGAPEDELDAIEAELDASEGGD
jgi:hypothetical protein